LHVVNVNDASSNSLGTFFNLRGLRAAPGGAYLSFSSSFNADPANDGMFVIGTAPGSTPQKLPWFGDYRWRDAESLFYITFNPANDIQQLHYYHVPTGQSMPLTQPDAQPFTIGGAEWSVSPDGSSIVFQEARDNNLWLIEAASELAESSSE
jgi:dipeptidyl aminopeptidase/acylaminoacyl peptidase